MQRGINEGHQTASIFLLKLRRSPRLGGANKDHIYSLACVQQEMPPILVRDETMQVIDGIHRLKVAQPNKATSIKAEFFSGTE